MQEFLISLTFNRLDLDRGSGRGEHDSHFGPIFLPDRSGGRGQGRFRGHRSYDLDGGADGTVFLEAL